MDSTTSHYGNRSGSTLVCEYGSAVQNALQSGMTQ